MRPDPLGITDFLSGALLMYTVSPIPAAIAEIHSIFLLAKGAATILEIPMPMPVYYLGGAADLLSATILYTGNPPILEAAAPILAGILFLKGVLTSLTMIGSI